MSSRSSRSASRTGAQRVARLVQLPMSLLCPRQKRARKRHRGGGGLAVPGPFKRIARGGGQKVTIRTAQRPLFEMGSAPRATFFAGAVTRGDLVKIEETLVNKDCRDRAAGYGT